MDLDGLIDSWGDRAVITVAGLLIGILFGVFAQRSRFCLRSATVEFWARQGTSRLAIWLFAFSAAMIATQALIAAFEAEFGARDCHRLLGCDLGTPEGQAHFREHRLRQRCAVFSGRAAELAAQQINAAASL